jgi:hypothetical protein
LAVAKETTTKISPPKTHEEVKSIFKEAAIQVAQTLREHGKGLDAAQLQEVALHVERTPFIGGLNRENVGKAIDAANRIPALSGSQQLGELKSAVGIMEKMLQVQQRSTANGISAQDVGSIER